MAKKIVFDPADVACLAAPLTLLEGDDWKITAPNRIVYQPMEGNDAEPDGSPSEVTLRRYRERATGFAGIDFVEALAVSPAGKARGDQLILSPATAEGYAELVAAYREINAETPLVFQLTHSGRFANEPVSPYPLADQQARLLTDADMAAIQDDLLTATRLAFACGADGIDFKHCHGYLFGAMLGPANRARTNWSWGGDTLEKRMRFFRETLARMHAEAPHDRFLYTVRISAFEGTPGGFGSLGAESLEPDPERTELLAFARAAEAAGVHLLNQSSGVPERTPLLVRQTNENPLGFHDHQAHAAALKGAVGIPVVGSGYSYLKAGANKLPEPDRAKKSLVRLAAQALADGEADLIGIGRQCLSDPGFANKLLTGAIDEIRWDTSCNQCAVSLRSGIHAGCVTYDRYYTELFRGMKRKKG